MWIVVNTKTLNKPKPRYPGYDPSNYNPNSYPKVKPLNKSQDLSINPKPHKHARMFLVMPSMLFIGKVLLNN